VACSGYICEREDKSYSVSMTDLMQQTRLRVRQWTEEYAKSREISKYVAGEVRRSTQPLPPPPRVWCIHLIWSI